MNDSRKSIGKYHENCRHYQQAFRQFTQYNIIISVTMQLRKSYLYILFSLLTTCFGPSWPSSGVPSYARTVKLYWSSFPHFSCAFMYIILVLLSTKLCCSFILLTFIKTVLFKIFVLKFHPYNLFLFLKSLPPTRHPPLVQSVYLCVSCLHCSGLLLRYCGYVPLVPLVWLRLPLLFFIFSTSVLVLPFSCGGRFP
jgi:hypothetical protein